MPATDLQQPRTPLQRTAPRRAKSQQRVAELLAAARAVFSEHGFQRATTAQIAEKAGVSEATVFTYFAGKRELCIQVISDWYDEISGDLEAQVPRLQGVRAKLAYVIRQHLVTLLADGSGMCALVLGEARADVSEKSRILTMVNGSGASGTYTLTAPIAGRVTSAAIHAGSVVDGTTAPYVIDAAGQYEAQAQLPERLAGQVKPGMTVSVCCCASSTMPDWRRVSCPQMTSISVRR